MNRKECCEKYVVVNQFLLNFIRYTLIYHPSGARLVGLKFTMFPEEGLANALASDPPADICASSASLWDLRCRSK